MALHVRGVAAPWIVIQAWRESSISASVRVDWIFCLPVVMQQYGPGFEVANVQHLHLQETKIAVGITGSHLKQRSSC